MGRNWFIINEKLPSLNDFISASRNYQAGNRFKRELQDRIIWEIKTQHVEPVTAPCVVLIDYFEKTQRRDVDNIQSSTKFILDAAQEAGVLPNDSQRWVKQIYHTVQKANKDYAVVYFYDDVNPLDFFPRSEFK